MVEYILTMTRDAMKHDAGQWTGSEVYDYYSESRGPFRPATQAVVNDVLEIYAESGGRHIEIGSGLGAFVHQVLPPDSPLREGIVQTEPSKPVLNLYRKRHAANPDQVPMLGATVYALPFAEGSADTVIGLSSFDTFGDTTQAMSEVSRVLKTGGCFVHFLDLEASPETFYHHLDPRVDTRVPIPTYLDGGASGVVMTPQEYLHDASERGDESDRRMFAHLLRCTPKEIHELSDQIRRRRLADFISKAGAESISYDEHFYRNMQQALKAAGLTIHLFGLQHSSVEVARQTLPDVWMEFLNRHRQNNTTNQLVNNKGVIYGESNKYVPEGMVRLISKIHCIVARKPGPDPDTGYEEFMRGVTQAHINQAQGAARRAYSTSGA